MRGLKKLNEQISIFNINNLVWFNLREKLKISQTTFPSSLAYLFLQMMNMRRVKVNGKTSFNMCRGKIN